MRTPLARLLPPTLALVWTLGLTGCLTEDAGLGPATGHADATADAATGGPDARPSDADPADGGAPGCVGALTAAPIALDFGRVPARETKTLQLTLTNTGQCPLRIHEVVLNGSQDFRPLIDGRDPRRRPAVLDDPDGDGAPGLTPGATLVLDVVYEAAVTGPAQAELVIRTDGAPVEQTIPLQANTGGVCLRILPDVVSFDPVAVGRVDERAITFEACGDRPVEIASITLTDSTDPAFSLRSAEVAVLTPGDAHTAQVRFSPVEARPHQGTVVIETTDPAQPVVRIGLLGLGAGEACPTAHVLPAPEVLSVGDVVVLDGAPSVDPDGPDRRPVQYEWTLIGAPPGSTAQVVERFFDALAPADGGPPDDVTTPLAYFSPGVPGRYTLRLDVVDAHGLRASECEATTDVVFLVEPPDGLRVRLTWTTEGDPTPGDAEGTDLDLYLLHPLAESSQDAPWACFSQAAAPDWGPEGPAGDPVLDVDDVNGDGPETIVLATPEATAEGGYRIGVHFVRDTPEYGPVVARVQVYAGAGLVGVAERRLEAPDAWWFPFEVTWPDGTPRPIDE